MRCQEVLSFLCGSEFLRSNLPTAPEPEDISAVQSTQTLEKVSLSKFTPPALGCRRDQRTPVECHSGCVGDVKRSEMLAKGNIVIELLQLLRPPSTPR